MIPPKHTQEEKRLAALYGYEILDTDYEQDFDDMTRLAAELLGAPISVINLIDRDRQWFKSEVGLGVRETPLDISICGHALLQPDVMVVPDLREDARFGHNPLVTGEPHLRFYAGALLESSDGYPVGTLCVLDHAPRESITELQKHALRVLARQVMTQMELRIRVRDADAARNEADTLRATKEREQTRLTDIFMRAPAFMATLRGPDHVFDMANPPYYQLIGHRDILGKSVAEALPEVVEQGFIGLLDQVYRTGEPFVGKDMGIRLKVTPDSPEEDHYLDFTYQPLFDEDGAVSGILAHGIDLTERKRLQLEQERLLAEARTQARREALLNQIGEAVRSAVDPEEVQARAVRLLGDALRLDRCYFVMHDTARPVFRVGRDWHRHDLPSIQGEYPAPLLNAVYADMYADRMTTTVYDDVTTASGLSPDTLAVMERFQVRALLGVALLDEKGTLIATLRAAMSDGPRHWTEGEVSLVETVATLVRTTVETVQARQRERNIAAQLQRALIPPIPRELPGLILASYYQPALNEAGVGGDFWDVFPVGTEATALVVADLSGKGLAAASQVATVRNMLRYALYTSEEIAPAITRLNQVLAQQDLLTGFATLFVGIYDHDARTLRYVNCGQEPGLIRRAATGELEHLCATGPVLGGFESAAGYEPDTVTLLPGDVLALFTDGLTEVGPNRKDLLEVSGVGELLRGCVNPAEDHPSPDEVVTCLIQGVDAYAQNGIRDDIALLVGVVQPLRGDSQ